MTTTAKTVSWKDLAGAISDGELVELETRLGLMRVRSAEKYHGYMLVHGHNVRSGAAQSSALPEARDRAA